MQLTIAVVEAILKSFSENVSKNVFNEWQRRWIICVALSTYVNKMEINHLIQILILLILQLFYSQILFYTIV